METDQYRCKTRTHENQACRFRCCEAAGGPGTKCCCGQQSREIAVSDEELNRCGHGCEGGVRELGNHRRGMGGNIVVKSRVGRSIEFKEDIEKAIRVKPVNLLRDKAGGVLARIQEQVEAAAG